MKKFTALFLVISLLGINCANHERRKGIKLEPDQKPGIKLVIQKTDGQQLRGELITVKQKSLLLMESESGVDVSSDIQDIETIIIKKNSKALLGVGVGFLLGAASGALIGYSMGDPEPSTGFHILGFWEYAAFKAFCIGFIGATLGALFGGTIGSRSGTDERIQIKGKSEAEIKEIIKELRKKARVPNFQ